MSLSDFDRMRNVRLPNWGRWGRQDSSRPDPEAGSGSIYQLGRADREATDEAPEPPPPRIDDKDAEWLDGLIGKKIAVEHRFVICGYFYKRKESFYPKVNAAVRALLDAEYAEL